MARRTGFGEGGAIKPFDLSDPRIPSTENIDLNNEEFDRGTPVAEGTLSIPDDVGRALSFALKLKNRNRGTSQTHVPKNVAMSVKPGASEIMPRCLV